MTGIIFHDDGTGDWRDKWVLDGLRAEVRNTQRGMIFEAGPCPGDNASHAVLWSRESFAGDFIMEFDYTRLDTINRYVNILYLQATGIGGDSPEDINSWAGEREVPYMKSYFERMKCLHISFAAFGNDNDKDEDYIRVRRYPKALDKDFSTVEVGETLFNTGLFSPGEMRHITVAKTDGSLSLKVEGKGVKTMENSWDTSHLTPLAPGPIGIRHMHTRCSRYGNIRISRPRPEFL